MGMESSESLIKYESALQKLANLIAKYQNLIDVCMVDFVTKNVFENAVPLELRESLQKLTESEISLLTNTFFNNDTDDSLKNSPLTVLLNELRQHTLESLDIVEDKDNMNKNLASFQIGQSIPCLSHFDKFMPDKKMHEVGVMNEIICQLCKKCNVDTLIDLGSGKAYLSQVLSASSQHLHILAIDSSNENSAGAKKRSDRLNSKWDALKKRADYRATGQEPPVRSKHPRSKKKDAITDTPEKQSKFDDNLRYITKFVDMNTDLRLLLNESFDNDTKDSPFNVERLGLIGLHTCGDLAPNSMRLWLGNESMKFLCNVGCCYHHLNEEFYRSPYLHEDQEDSSVPSFPLSSKLKSLQYKLGRNARMIAAQPMDRLRTNKELPRESLLWRAILQHILLIHVPDLNFEDHQVF